MSHAATIDVSVLIVSYNTRELTLACLASVYEQTRGPRFEVIVVDNASRDGSADAIAAQFPAADLLALPENVGFARANNLVARRAQGRYLLLLNPDTVIQDNAIQKVVAFADAHPDAGLVGGRTFYGDGTLNYGSCWGRPTAWSMLCTGLGLAAVFRRSALFNPESLGRWPRDSVRAVDIVTGCFALIPRDLWRQLGGFDEAFFMYSEDADLSQRVWAAGRRCMLCPEAQLIHHGGASEKVRADKMVRLFAARAQLLAKHWPPAKARFGVRMLDCWAWTRMTALRLLRRREAYAVWREIWNRRDQWRVANARRAPSAAVALSRSGGG